MIDAEQVSGLGDLSGVANLIDGRDDDTLSEVHDVDLLFGDFDSDFNVTDRANDDVFETRLAA